MVTSRCWTARHNTGAVAADRGSVLGAGAAPRGSSTCRSEAVRAMSTHRNPPSPYDGWAVLTSIHWAATCTQMTRTTGWSFEGSEAGIACG